MSVVRWKTPTSDVFSRELHSLKIPARPVSRHAPVMACPHLFPKQDKLYPETETLFPETGFCCRKRKQNILNFRIQICRFWQWSHLKRQQNILFRDTKFLFQDTKFPFEDRKFPFQDTKFLFRDTIYPVSGYKVPVSGYKLSCFGNKCGQAITMPEL